VNALQARTPGVAPAAPGNLQIEVSHQGERHMSVLLNRVVSRSPGVDEPCVNAGIDKVEDQLQ
jgi:hypothetical protein